MRSLSLVGLAALIALGASPVWAQTDTKTQITSTTVSTKKAVNPDEVICVHHNDIESRIPGPAECHPRHVWDEMAEAAHRDAQNMQQTAGMTHPGGLGSGH